MAITLSVNRRQRFLIAAIVFTSVLLGFTGWIRLEEGSVPLSHPAWKDVAINPEILGLALQELFIPLIGLYLFSGTSFFEQVVTLPSIHKTERLKLTTIFIILLMISVITSGLLSAENVGLVTHGMIIVLSAGLLGGWRTASVIGAVTMLFYGAYFLVLEIHLETFETFQDMLTYLLDVFWWNVLDFTTLAILWGGVLIGMWRDDQGGQVWQSLPLFLAGILFEWFPAWLIFWVTGDVENIVAHLPVAIITGFVLVIFGLLVRQAQGRFAEKQLASAEHARMQAELRALRAQINPHFLFNALSTIRYHARTNPDKAYDLLEDLSEVFHNALNSDAFITLEGELGMVTSYLAIEEARMGERLKVVWQIDENVDVEHPVPTLIIQPLVENAVMHGIAPQSGGGTITIAAQQKNRQIHIKITDDGQGFDLDNPQTKGSGIGLTNIKERLIALYGSEFALLVDSRIGQGTRVTMRIPL